MQRLNVRSRAQVTGAKLSPT